MITYTFLFFFSNVKPRFSDEHSCHMETVIDPNNKHGRCIQITKMDAEEQRKVEADRDKLEFDDLDSAVGFAKVIKKISESRKPVIGKRHIAALVYFFP